MKLQPMFILWVQTRCKRSVNFPLWHSIWIDYLRDSSLCPWSKKAFEPWSTCQEICIAKVNLTLRILHILVVLFAVTVRRKTFGIWAWKRWLSTKRLQERERRVWILEAYLFSSIAEIWLSHYLFTEGFLFKRRNKQAN